MNALRMALVWIVVFLQLFGYLLLVWYPGLGFIILGVAFVLIVLLVILLIIDRQKEKKEDDSNDYSDY